MTKREKAKVLESALSILFENSKFVEFHRFKIEIDEDNYFVLLNPGVPERFTSLKKLSNVLVEMLDNYF